MSSLPEMDSSSYTIATPTDEAEEDDDDVRWLAVCAIIVGCASLSSYQVFLDCGAGFQDKGPCKKRRLLKPLTLTPEVAFL